MTLQELFAVMASALWAVLWWPVGRQFGWWAGAGAAAGGALAGLALGWLLGEWLNGLRPHANRARTAAEVVGCLAASLAFVALPLWASWLLRAG